MTAVLMTPPYMYFTDDDGAPLAGGLIYTYAAGSYSTPKAAYTTAAGDTEHTNPIELDSSGRAVIFIDGSYNYIVKTAAGVTIRSVPNVTSFTALDSQSDSYQETFSGNGTTTAFTTSEDLGTDEKAIYVWVDQGLQQHVANGTFATDTIWTKGAGWTIAAGVATATGAISTAISQASTVTVLQGQAYIVTMTITLSAGGLIPSIGGTNGTERTSSGTYVETIIAGSTQTIAFTGNAFTGTLDTVTVTPAVSKGYQIQPATAFTINGTALTFNSAPATGTGNILVSAPLLAVGSASSSAAAAQAAEAAALAAQVAAEAAAANLRGTSTTSLLIGTGSKIFTTQSGKQFNVGNWLLAVSDADEANYMHGQVTAYSGTSLTVNVTNTGGSGTLADWSIYVSGTQGTTGATGSIGDIAAQTEAVVTASDLFVFADVDAANATRRDTVQGILDLVPDTGWVPIKTVTASAVATVDFVNGSGGVILDGTYKAYVVLLTNVVPATDGADLTMRTSTNAGSSYASSSDDYEYQLVEALNGSIASKANSATATAIILFIDASSTATNGGVNGIVRIDNPSAANKITVGIHADGVNSSPLPASYIGMGYRNAAANVDAIRFLFDTGNITSGVFTLYGLASAA